MKLLGMKMKTMNDEVEVDDDEDEINDEGK